MRTDLPACRWVVNCMRNEKLDAGHSTECITDTDHSSALNKTDSPARLCRRATRQPCGTVSLRDDTTATRLLTLTTLARRYALCDPVTFYLWSFHCWVRYRDGQSVCQVWRFWFKPFWFYRADTQTPRAQTESQKRMIAILTWLPSAWVTTVNGYRMWFYRPKRYDLHAQRYIGLVWYGSQPVVTNAQHGIICGVVVVDLNTLNSWV